MNKFTSRAVFAMKCGLAMAVSQVVSGAEAQSAGSGIEEIIIRAIRADRQSRGATGLDLSVYETPQFLTVLDADAIADFRLVDINSMLKLTTGVNVDSNETQLTEDMYLVFPSEALTRVKVSSDVEGRYVVLGLSLTMVSATGINIWLEKRKYRDALNLVWPGLVWGMVPALVVAALVQVVFPLPSMPVFWAGLLAAMTAGLFVRDETLYRHYLQDLTAATLVLLVGAYTLKFGRAAFSPAGLSVSLVLVGIALLFFLVGGGRSRKHPANRSVAGGIRLPEPGNSPFPAHSDRNSRYVPGQATAAGKSYYGICRQHCLMSGQNQKTRTEQVQLGERCQRTTRRAKAGGKGCHRCWKASWPASRCCFVWSEG